MTRACQETRCAAATVKIPNLVQQVAKKKFGMLRDPQHERKIINGFKSTPFVLSYVEGLRKDFIDAGLLEELVCTGYIDALYR